MSADKQINSEIDKTKLVAKYSTKTGEMLNYKGESLGFDPRYTYTPMTLKLK